MAKQGGWLRILLVLVGIIIFFIIKKKVTKEGFICPAGSQPAAGALSTGCAPCSVGTFKPSYGAQICQGCPIGYYSYTGATSCMMCGSGNYSSGGRCIQCVGNTYQPTTPATSYCLTAPANSTVNGSKTDYSCNTNYTRTNNTCVLTSCPAGQEPNSNSTACQLCSAGKYKDATDLSRCISCAANTFKSQSGQGSCLPCPANSTCAPDGTITTTGLATYICKDGYLKNTTTNTCDPCPPGKAGTGGACATTCGAGSFSAGGASSCTTCPVNTYQNASGQSSCKPCPENSTCAVGGTITTPGQTTFTCKRGYKLNSTNDGCEICPPGTYALAANNICYPCSNYTNPSAYQDKAGQNACITQPANATVNAARTGFTCNNGFEKNATNDGCVACTSPKYGVNGECVPCPANMEFHNNVSCKCAVGYYGAGNQVPFGGYQAGCTPCPANSTMPATRGYQTTVNHCRCNIGYYMSNGQCVACPANSTTVADGATAITQCVASAGYYMSGGQVLACPANTTSPAGSTAVTQCVCSKGYYGTNRVCTQCPGGSTTNQTNSTSISQCICEAGSYRTGTGTSLLCNKAQDGWWAALASTSQTECVKPSNADRMTTGGLGAGKSANDCKIQKCANGYEILTGTPGSCQQCGANKYSDDGVSCKSCGADFTSAEGSTSEADCKCPANKFKDGSSCASCPVGMTSDAGSTSTNDCKCPVNTYRQGSTCVPCETGLVSPIGSTLASQCECPTGEKRIRNRQNQGQCIPSCDIPDLSNKQKGSPDLVLLDGYDCGTRQFKYTTSTGSIVNENPCGLQSVYNFDTKRCEDERGGLITDTTTTRCTDSQVYDERVNSCIPVRTPATPERLQGTIGTPGAGDYRDCQTIDQGDCTLLYRDPANPTGPKLTTNPCTASGRRYNFATKACEAEANPCCNPSLTPAQAAANPQCASLLVAQPRTRNPQKCPRPTANVCCQPNNANNATCIRNGFWNPPTYTWSPQRASQCASGFEDYKSELDTIAQKRAKRLARGY